MTSRSSEILLGRLTGHSTTEWASFSHSIRLVKKSEPTSALLFPWIKMSEKNQTVPAYERKIPKQRWVIPPAKKQPRQGGNNEVGGIVPATLPERPAAARKRRPRTLRTLLEHRSFFLRARHDHRQRPRPQPPGAGESLPGRRVRVRLPLHELDWKLSHPRRRTGYRCVRSPARVSFTSCFVVPRRVSAF